MNTEPLKKFTSTSFLMDSFNSNSTFCLPETIRVFSQLLLVVMLGLEENKFSRTNSEGNEHAWI